MLCYRCGSHVPDHVETCPACGQKLAGGGLRQATGTFSRRRATSGSIEGAPYKVQDLVANRYLVKDVVGQGPLGHVFRAHDKEIDVEVALKVINPRLVQTPDERKQFSKVMRTARKLSHPNLVRVYEEGEDADRPYFTSQFLDGLTLRKIIDLRLQKGQFFALHEIEPILSQVCAALEGAHKVGPHTDLKPDNVLVLPDLLKVTDFGLGVAMPRPPFVQAMKARKADRYLAPELIDGNEVDLRCDVYSVGVILGEMLSGLTPDGALPELSRRNPEVPAAVEGLYRKVLNSNPNARCKTADEFIGELIDLLRKAAPQVASERPESATGGSPPTRPRTTTGMLQLQPRKAPTVSDMPLPPPPPPTSGETPMPDATQPVDPAMLKIALERPLKNGHLDFDLNENRQQTDVLDSGQFASAAERGEPQQGRVLFEGALGGAGTTPHRTWVYVLLLIVLGVGVGAGGGWFMIERQKTSALEGQRREFEEKARLEVERRRDDEARVQAEIAAKAAAATRVEQTPAEKAAAAALKVAADKIAADKVALEKAEAEKRATREKAMTASPALAGKAGGGGCPEGMRPVAAGPFKMGTSRDDSMMGFDEKPLAVVDVPTFCVDTFEFPNKRGLAPMVSIGWADAKRQCESQSKRLCSEAEWEKSCKGPVGARWPYGNSFEATLCNTEDESGEPRAMAPGGRFAKCRSGYGVFDLSGNASEWTAEKMIKGGSFSSSDYAVRCSARKNGAAFAKSAEVGFRCCADPQ